MTDSGGLPDPAPAATVALLRRRLEQGPIELPVSGASMGATISAGSTVTVVAASSPRPGQIWALVDDEGQMFVHRYRKQVAGRMVFRGDGNITDDPPAGPESLIGQVVAATYDGVTTRFGVKDRILAIIGHLRDALARRLFRT